MKNAPILCYGTPDDRLRLAAIAKAHHQSGSGWILEQIRDHYRRLYGDTPVSAS